jgi:hypothetical protein
MNKELIKKYREEFNHWLDGGQLLYRDTVWVDANNWTIDGRGEVFNKQHNTDTLNIIIDDEYVELRKAQAGGAQIQYYVDSFVGWQDTEHFNQAVQGAYNYRIKGLKMRDRVTPTRIEEVIKKEEFHKLTDTLTLCVLTLENGFTVTGESACTDPKNYDKKIGEELSRNKAVEKIWPLEGYLLKQELYKK